MKFDKLRDRFSNEKTCRNFFESIIWQNGRQCPHCGSLRSCQLNEASVRAGVYESSIRYPVCKYVPWNPSLSPRLFTGKGIVVYFEYLKLRLFYRFRHMLKYLSILGTENGYNRFQISCY